MATATALKATKRRGTLAGSIPAKPGKAAVGRQRLVEPDPNTPTGQWALYFRRLLGSRDIEDFGKSIGKSRSMMFKYLRGESVPHFPVWTQIAEELGLPGWWSLVPPESFLKEIGVKTGRRKS